MRYYLALFLILSLINTLQASEHAYGDIPSGSAYIERNAYIIQFDAEFDAEHKTPRWVAYHVKPEHLDAPDRSKTKWKEVQKRT